jgi:hypothetical protein
VRRGVGGAGWITGPVDDTAPEVTGATVLAAGVLAAADVSGTPGCDDGPACPAPVVVLEQAASAAQPATSAAPSDFTADSVPG